MIQAANQEALRRLKQASPRLVDVRPAGEVLEDFDRQTILHAGPPVAYERMCAPMREAVHGVLCYEGWRRIGRMPPLWRPAARFAFSPATSGGW